MKNTNSNLKTLRLCAGLTQEALAVKMCVTEATVCRWETGLRRISAENALRMEKVTNGKIPKEAVRPDIFGQEVSPATQKNLSVSNTLTNPND